LGGGREGRKKNEKEGRKGRKEGKQGEITSGWLLAGVNKLPTWHYCSFLLPPGRCQGLYGKPQQHQMHQNYLLKMLCGERI
jgi:hypothetical protein